MVFGLVEKFLVDGLERQFTDRRQLHFLQGGEALCKMRQRQNNEKKKKELQRTWQVTLLFSVSVHNYIQ